MVMLLMMLMLMLWAPGTAVTFAGKGLKWAVSWYCDLVVIVPVRELLLYYIA